MVVNVLQDKDLENGITYQIIECTECGFNGKHGASDNLQVKCPSCEIPFILDSILESGEE